MLFNCYLTLLFLFSYNTVSSSDTASVNEEEDGASNLPVVSLQVRDRTHDRHEIEDDEFFPVSLFNFLTEFSLKNYSLIDLK